MTTESAETFRDHILAFVARHRAPGQLPGRYVYAACQTQPILYASAYAALARHQLDNLSALADTERAEWVAYMQSFQDDDGFFKDPPIAHPGSWYVPPHMEWCGWWHLTCHAIMGLAALGGVAPREFAVLKPFYDEKQLAAWLEARNLQKMDFVGNEILNLGQILQYARDLQNCSRAQRPMDMIFDWLNRVQNPDTGQWGPFDTPENRNKSYQGAYHFYLLYEYDKRPVKHAERILDTMLEMQTPQGGFGIRQNTSGCEDIDAIDPLVRYSQHAPQHRRADVTAALRRAFDWVLQNRTPDGGFAFIRDRDFFYGSKFMFSEKDQGSLFATWWRMLSLAILSRVVTEHPLAQVKWQFLRCPGYQFMD